MSLDDYDRAAARLGRTLEDLRRGAGLTQLELKQAIGMRRAHIDAVEEGLKPIDFYGLWCWAEACGKKVEVRLSPQGESAALTEEERGHIEALRMLEPGVRRHLLALVHSMAGEPRRG